MVHKPTCKGQNYDILRKEHRNKELSQNDSKSSCKKPTKEKYRISLKNACDKETIKSYKHIG